MFKINLSPESVIEEAKHCFLSEDFSSAFNILRDCFSEDEVDKETILKIFKGELGYNVDENNNILLSEEFVKNEYKYEVSSVLENYDFLVNIDDDIYQVDGFLDININHYSDINPWVKEIKESKDKLTKISDFKYSKEIVNLLSEHNYFYDCEYIVLRNDKFYMFKKYNLPNIPEICSFYTFLDAIDAFCEKIESDYL